MSVCNVFLIYIVCVFFLKPKDILFFLKNFKKILNKTKKLKNSVKNYVDNKLKIPQNKQILLKKPKQIVEKDFSIKLPIYKKTQKKHY